MQDKTSGKYSYRFVASLCFSLAAALFTADMPMTSYAAPGDLDPTFSGDGRLTDGEGWASDVAIQPDGKIVAAGGAPGTQAAVARYNSDGSRDTTFGGTGIVDAGHFDSAKAIAVQPDGKIVAAGIQYWEYSEYYFVVTRYHPDGSRDTSFNGGSTSTQFIGHSYVNDVAIQPDGKIVVVGSVDNNFVLVRYNPNGSFDTSFGGDGIVTTPIGTGNATASSVVQQNDGKIVVAGSSRNGSDDTTFTLARYNIDGSLDSTFDGDGIVTTLTSTQDEVFSSVLQPDGKIIVAGSRLIISNDYDPTGFALIRYNPNGSLDTTFGGGGLVTTGVGIHSRAQSVALQPDGKVVAVGYNYSDDSNSDFVLVRLTPNGSLDATFGGDGITTADFDNSSDYAHGMALDSAGRAVVVGESEGRFAIARFLLNPAEEVSISGRVTTANGRGLGNAVVTLVDSLGRRRTATTSTFGYFSFKHIPADTYNIAIRSKRYAFEPRTVIVNENLSGIDFVALK